MRRDGTLPAAAAERFRAIAVDLTALYPAHIAVEDGSVFPLAGHLLSREQQLAIGGEIAARRR